MEEAKQLLIQQKQWVATYDSDGFEDLLAAGETVLAHGWSGDFFAAAEEAEEVWYAIPQEGGVIWTDNLCIPKTASNQYTAEVFINYLLRPEVGAKITNFTWYGSPNKAAEAFIDAEILEEPAIYPPPEVMEQAWSSCATWARPRPSTSACGPRSRSSRSDRLPALAGPQSAPSRGLVELGTAATGAG